MPNIQVGNQVIAFPDDMSADDLNKAVGTAYKQINGEKSLREKVYDQAKSISPELVDPTNLIPGVIGSKLMNVAMEKSQEGYNKLGDITAEAIDQGGKHPYLSAAIGTPIKMANEIAAGVAGIKDAPALAEGVEAIGSGVKGGIGSILDKLKALKNTPSVAEQEAINASKLGQFRPAANKLQDLAESMMGPQTDKVAALKADLTNLPTENAKFMQGLNQTKATAGKQLGEELNKVSPFKSTPEFEKLVGSKEALSAEAEKYSKKFGELSSSEIAKAVPAKDLRHVKEFASAGQGKLSNTGNIQLTQLKNKAYDAMAVQNKNIEIALNNYKQHMKIVDEAPNIMQHTKVELKAKLLKAESDLKKVQADFKSSMSSVKQADAEELANLHKEAVAAIKKAQGIEDIRKKITYGILGSAGAGLVYAAKKVIQ